MIEKGYDPGGLTIIENGLGANMYKWYICGANNSCQYCHYNLKPIPIAEQLLKSDLENINFRKNEQ